MPIKNYTTELNTILKKICTIGVVDEVYLYGSHARADYQKNSDIDLAIVCPKATADEWVNILSIIEDLPLLQKVDVVRLDMLDEANGLYKAILRDKILLYKKGQEVIDPYLMDAFYKLQKAFYALKEIAQKPMQEDRSNVDATIQRFEFTIELFWKMFKKLLLKQGVETTYPKDVLREAYAGKLIENDRVWLSMLHDRNLTSHTYDEMLADEIFARIQTYIPYFEHAMQNVKTQLGEG